MGCLLGDLGPCEICKVGLEGLEGGQEGGLPQQAQDRASEA